MRALISVSDKTGIVDFAKGLQALGVSLISTGGTYKQLKEAGCEVTAIDEVTGFPEMLNGRVKTLHPKIHGGLLALRDNTEHMATCEQHGIGLIDLVIVNLYPFEATIKRSDVTRELAIENIDIGGPSMIRSAAKNHQSVGVIVNPDRYETILTELKAAGALSTKTKQALALEAFEHTAAYDGLIATYLAGEYGTDNLPETVSIQATKQVDLRYGENPHQAAAFYKVGAGEGLASIKQHHGKELSYNNIVDGEAAWEIARSFTQPACAIIKHTNPCGVAQAATLADAYDKALAADPVSAFGSIIGVNREVDEKTAHAMSSLFVEAIIAPSFSQAALDVLTQKPSIRLLEIPVFDQAHPKYIQKFVLGGVLMQSPDTKIVTKDEVTVATKTTPTDAQLEDLLFAFTVVKHVKSNAIVIAKDGVAVGVGAGQMSRVESSEIAIKRAGDRVTGAIVASDAFFPFRDSIDQLAKAGVSAIIQPGGSKRDEEVIAACDEAGISMVMTGVRHFKH